MLNSGYSNPSAMLIITSCMFMPAISVIITILITKSKFNEVWFKPNFKANIKYYLIGWLAPISLILIGCIVYFIIFPYHFDLNMTNMINATKNQLSSLGQSIPADSQLKSMIILQWDIIMDLIIQQHHFGE